MLWTTVTESWRHVTVYNRCNKHYYQNLMQVCKPNFYQNNKKNIGLQHIHLLSKPCTLSTDSEKSMQYSLMNVFMPNYCSHNTWY